MRFIDRGQTDIKLYKFDTNAPSTSAVSSKLTGLSNELKRKLKPTKSVDWETVKVFGITDEMLARYNNMRGEEAALEPKLDVCREIIYWCDQWGCEVDTSKVLSKFGSSPDIVLLQLFQSLDNRNLSIDRDAALYNELKFLGFPSVYHTNVSNVFVNGQLFDYDGNIGENIYHIQLYKTTAEILITCSDVPGEYKEGVAIAMNNMMLSDRNMYIGKLLDAVDSYRCNKFIFNGVRKWQQKY